MLGCRCVWRAGRAVTVGRSGWAPEVVRHPCPLGTAECGGVRQLSGRRSGARRRARPARPGSGGGGRTWSGGGRGSAAAVAGGGGGGGGRGRQTARDEEEARDEQLVFGVFPVLGALTAGRRRLAAVMLQDSLFNRAAVEQYNAWVGTNNHVAAGRGGDRRARHGGRAHSLSAETVHQQLASACTSTDPQRRSKLCRIVSAAFTAGVPIELCSRKYMDHCTSHAVHQGVLVRASPLEFVHLDAADLPRAEAVCAGLPAAPATPAPASAPPQVWLALDGVTDPQNFGAVLRTAAFLGLSGVMVCGRNAAPLSPVASKASAGAMEAVPVHAVRNLASTLAALRKQRWVTLGAAMAEEGEGEAVVAAWGDDEQGDSGRRSEWGAEGGSAGRLYRTERRRDTSSSQRGGRGVANRKPEGTAGARGGPEPRPKAVWDMRTYVHRDGAAHVVLVLGSEGHGLRRTVRAQCDGLVHVSPACVGGGSGANAETETGLEGAYAVARAGVPRGSAFLDSLNVSVAGAILMYKLVEAVERAAAGGVAAGGAAPAGTGRDAALLPDQTDDTHGGGDDRRGVC